MFDTIFKSLPQALPNIFLTLIGTARITQGITVLNALKDDFPNWKYFLAEFEQYVQGQKVMFSNKLDTNSRHFQCDLFLIYNTFHTTKTTDHFYSLNTIFWQSISQSINYIYR